MKKNTSLLIWIALVLSIITTKASAQPGYYGEIKLFAGIFPPKDWAFCNGQILLIQDNVMLFSILGTKYGGDGTTTFPLPDFRGKVAMGMGKGTGMAEIKLGEATGENYLKLEEKNMPRHSHDLSGTTSALNSSLNGKSVPVILSVSEKTVKDSIATMIQGSASPFDNRQPSIALNYIICIRGTFLPLKSSELYEILPEPDTTAYTGQILAFAGDFAPPNWALCNGQKMDKTVYKLLFNTIGSSFDSTSTDFYLPDLRGNIVIGSGQGTGLTNRKTGERVGSKQIQLQKNNIPHSHLIFNQSTDEEKLNDKNYFIPVAEPAPVSSSIVSGLAGGNSTPITNIQPSLAINYLICLKGKSKQFNYYDSHPGYIGEIRSIAGNDIPEGWKLCDGRPMKIPEALSLYSLLGTIYGGDGLNTFHLPDLRGRAVIGAGSGINQEHKKNPWDNIEEIQRGGGQIGAETTQLEYNNLPPHAHKFAVMEEKNATQSSFNTKVLAVKRSNWQYTNSEFFTDNETRVMPIDNMQPSLVLNYIICVKGIFPGRN